MILTVTCNAAVDHTVFVDGLKQHDTNRVRRMETDAGGKGINVARVVVELGGKARATGLLGGGPGGFVRQVLDDQGVPHSFVDVRADTRINFSVEDGSGKPPTTFNAYGAEVETQKWESLQATVREQAKQSNWVVLGGSIPRGLPKDSYRVLGAIAHESGARLMIDADGEVMQLGIETAPNFIKPNRREAERLLGNEIPDLESALSALNDLHDLLCAKGGMDPLVIVSLGANGAVLRQGDLKLIGQAPSVDAKSTIGSGDSMVAGVLAALQAGEALESALAWGLAAGAATAVTDGSEIARRPVFESLLPQALVRKVS